MTMLILARGYWSSARCCPVRSKRRGDGVSQQPAGGRPPPRESYFEVLPTPAGGALFAAMRLIRPSMPSCRTTASNSER